MTTEADAIAALANKQAQVIAGPSDRSFLIVPSGYHSREITDPNGLPPAPSYVRQAIAVQDGPSLVS